MVPSDITVDVLRERGYEPKWFGLGFIQMKINENERLHFWHPELLPDVPDEEIHDHRYDFTSTVVTGKLTHEVYDFVAVNTDVTNADYQMAFVSCDPTKPLSETSQEITFGEIQSYGSQILTAGSSYFFPSRRFHKTHAKRAVTYLERGPVQYEYARSIRPIDSPSICPFSNPLPTNMLWECIADLLPRENHKPGYHIASIAKGKIGEASKIREELEEFEDALRQNANIMALVELSDMVGAIDLYLKNHFQSTVGINDLVQMSNITQRAFKNGFRD